MLDTKTPTATKPGEANKSKPAEPKRLYVETVYGRMVDLSTSIEYNQSPKEIIRMNGWLQSQIDAGKMKLCGA